MPHRAFIGIGTNLGDRAANYREAITRIAGLPETRVLRQSSVYETEPVGEVEMMQPFLNGAIEIATEIPADLLDKANEFHTTLVEAVDKVEKNLKKKK